MPTYYFDASDAGPTDADAAWQNLSNGFDGSITTVAQANVASMNGNDTTQVLFAEGTNAPSEGAVILGVRVRIYGATSPDSHSHSAKVYTNGLGEVLGTATMSSSTTNWGSYTTLSVPTGGWTWSVIQSLEVKCYAVDNGIGVPGFYKVEVEVDTSSAPGSFNRRIKVGDGILRSESAT